MTPGKALFLFNVAALIACWITTSYSDNKNGENSMSAALPTIFIIAITAIVDLAFIAVRTVHWLFN